MENKRVINQWDNAAVNYATNQRTAKNQITNNDILFEMLGSIKGKKVLDAGCGDGYFTSLLKKKGADICGCDGSTQLINIAKEEFSGIDFRVCDLTKRLPYEAESFDLVVSSLVIMDIRDIEKFFSEAARVLKKDGKLVFTIVHPCFFQCDWHTNEKGERDYKILNKYWGLNQLTLNFWGETTHYHRPLTWYSNVLSKNGFAITRIKENPEKKEHFERLSERQKKIPLFICLECVKLKKA